MEEELLSHLEDPGRGSFVRAGQVRAGQVMVGQVEDRATMSGQDR